MTPFLVAGPYEIFLVTYKYTESEQWGRVHEFQTWPRRIWRTMNADYVSEGLAKQMFIDELKRGEYGI